jgi:hypothetical protein
MSRVFAPGAGSIAVQSLVADRVALIPRATPFLISPPNDCDQTESIPRNSSSRNKPLSVN